MRGIIVALICFAPIVCIGQERELVESPFSIGLNFSPNYSYRTLNYGEELNSFVDAREALEHPSFGFNTGIVVQYAIGQPIELAMNVQVSRQTHIFKDVPVGDVLGGATGGFADNQLRYYYLEIPVRANYHFLKGKVFAYATAGASLNLFLRDESKSRITYADGETDERSSATAIQDYNITAFGLIGGVGLGYHLNEKWDVRMEPVFRYSLTPLADAPIHQYNYSIGCQFGVNVKL